MRNLLTMVPLWVSTSLFAQETDSSRFYLDKAMQEKEKGKYMMASVYFDKAIKFDPDNKDIYMQVGYTQLAMKKNTRATEAFSKLLELDPGNEKAMTELMELYYNNLQYDKAIALAQKCARCLNSTRIQGLSHYRREDYLNAEKQLLAVLQKTPDDKEVTYTLARNYLDMEETKKALPYLKKAVQLNETQPKWQYELGLLYFTLMDYRNALASFEQAEKNGLSRTNDFIENLGFAALYSGEFDKGENNLLEIFKRKPGNKEILRDIAEILFQQKQFDRSLNYCQKLLELDVKDGKALYQAGLCFQKKGEKSRGQQMCDNAIQLDPSLENLRRKKEMAGL